MASDEMFENVVDGRTGDGILVMLYPIYEPWAQAS